MQHVPESPEASTRSPETQRPAGRNGDDTVFEEETMLGPTQAYCPSPHLLEPLLKTPVKGAAKPFKNDTPSPDPHHVLTDVTWEEDMDEDYEREKMLWEMWRKDKIVRVAHQIKKLVKKKEEFECLKYPEFEEWMRNGQLALAAEKGLKQYSNKNTFGDLGHTLENQMIGREMKRSIDEVASAGSNHPAMKAKKLY